MDTDRFDDLLRSLASGTSRRGVLAGLAGGLLAALPPALGGDDVAAGRRKKKKKKKKKKKPSSPPTSPPACVPSCGDRRCGPNGCGGVCGSCPAAQTCSGSGEECFCPAGITCENACCTGSEVCHLSSTDPPFCQSGGCPTVNFCNSTDIYVCGEGCACATSINDENICSDFDNFSCTACTSDAQCQTSFDLNSVCIPGGLACQGFCGTTENFCVVPGCPS